MLKRTIPEQNASNSSSEEQFQDLSHYTESQNLEKELAELERELHERAEALSNVENIPQSPPAAQLANELAEQAPDEGTKEFVTLVEFIKREHDRSKQMKNPDHKAKVLKLLNYVKVREREFEQLQKQKGLQLNKAA